MGGINYLTASLNRHIPQSEYAVAHILCISYLLYLLIVIFWLILSEARVWCTIKTIVHAVARSHGDAGSINSNSICWHQFSKLDEAPPTVDDTEMSFTF